jgi:hypothetical protein
MIDGVLSTLRTVVRIGLVAAGCGPANRAATEEMPPPSAGVASPTAPVSPTPAPASTPIAVTAPVEGTVGTPGFVRLLAAAPSGAWVILCQARADTDKDGSIDVQTGHHGEYFGDELAPYFIRGAGEGEALDAFVAVDPTSRWIVVIRNGSMQLVDTATDTGSSRPSNRRLPTQAICRDHSRGSARSRLPRDARGHRLRRRAVDDCILEPRTASSNRPSACDILATA